GQIRLRNPRNLDPDRSGITGARNASRLFPRAALAFPRCDHPARGGFPGRRRQARVSAPPSGSDPMSQIGAARGAESVGSGARNSADIHGALARSAAAALEQLCACFVAEATELEKARDDAGIARLRDRRLQVAEALAGFPGAIERRLAQALNSTTACCLKSAIRALPRNPRERARFAQH